VGLVELVPRLGQLKPNSPQAFEDIFIVITLNLKGIETVLVLLSQLVESRAVEVDGRNYGRGPVGPTPNRAACLIQAVAERISVMHTDVARPRSSVFVGLDCYGRCISVTAAQKKGTAGRPRTSWMVLVSATFQNTSMKRLSRSQCGCQRIQL